MWKLQGIILSLVIVVSMATSALAESFEGTLKTKVQSKGRSIEVVAHFKGSVARADASESGTKLVTMVLDLTSQTATIADHIKHRVSTHTFADLKAASLKKAKKKPGPFTKTGEHGVIAGYPVEQYVHSHEDGTIVEWWATSKLALSPELQQTISELCTGQPPSPDYARMVESGLVNLRTIRRASNGSIVFNSEIVEVSPTVLPDSLFKISNPYK
jgi:Domain of unknown function (DUF4412)